MKILFEQLNPYTHKKDIRVYKRVEVKDYHFSKDGICCYYTLPNGVQLTSFRMYENESDVEGIDVTDLKVLPYFADVIQDLPSQYKFEPKTYIGAQLMVERKGSYQYYKHEGADDLLLIAMNSNIVTEYK